MWVARFCASFSNSNVPWYSGLQLFWIRYSSRSARGVAASCDGNEVPQFVVVSPFLTSIIC